VAVADYRGRLRSQLLELLQAKVLRDTSHWVGCYVTRSFSVLTIAIATPLRPHATTILDLNSDDALGRGRVLLLYRTAVVSSFPSRLGGGHVL
jgi:hypothetical protein